MDDVTEKLTYQQRCEAFMAEMIAVGNRYGVHAMVTSFCFDEEDGVKGRTAALGCPEHCKMMFHRISAEMPRYLQMTDKAAANPKADQVH